VARLPHPLPSQFFEPPVAPEPLRGLWTGALAAALLVFTAVGGLFKEIAARWRGIVLAHIFFLTLWLAIQVFFFATGAYWCLPSEGSKFAEWVFKYFPQISRCLPTVSVHGSLTPSGSLVVSSFASPKASSPGSDPVSSPRSPAASPPASPPAPSPGPPAASSPGLAASYSSRWVANCWRDRTLGSNCYARTETRRKLPPARSRYPTFPCRRASDCGWDAI